MNTRLKKLKANDWLILLIASWLTVSLTGGCGLDSSNIDQSSATPETQAETQPQENAADDITEDDIEDETGDITDDGIEDETGDTPEGGDENETTDTDEETLGPDTEPFNVIYGHPARLEGEFFTNGWATAEIPETPSQVASDGLFFELSHEWDIGTVWWSGLEPHLIIELDASYLIESVVVQTDDNDSYQLSYHVPGTDDDVWVALYEAPAVSGIGMQIREQFYLSEPIEADAFRFEALSGDNRFSVGELQAFGYLADKD